MHPSSSTPQTSLRACCPVRCFITESEGWPIASVLCFPGFKATPRPKLGNLLSGRDSRSAAAHTLRVQGAAAPLSSYGVRFSQRGLKGHRVKVTGFRPYAGFKVKALRRFQGKGYRIQFMINNTNRYVTHFQGDASRPPVGLAEHIAWLEGQLVGIPAEYRASAEVEYEAPESCEQSNGWLYIRYQRPETPEECVERLAALRERNKARAAAREARKLWEERLAAQMASAAANNPAK